MTETNMNTSNPYDGETDCRNGRFPAAGRDGAGHRSRHRRRAAGQSETGMIEIKGPNVFKGYWRMPEKTAAEFTKDGYFISGDLGKIDGDGYVHIVGRGKDLVISGGYNIYPKEVEGEIDQLDGVVESAVIGVPHPDFGEGVTAVVVSQARRRPGRKGHTRRAPGPSRPLQAAQAGHLRRGPAAQHDGQGAEEHSAASNTADLVRQGR